MQVVAHQGCRDCRTSVGVPFAFTMAFQPIVDVSTCRIWAYEALVRGTKGESAATILSMVSSDLTYAFDQACRVRAVELAGALFERDDETKLSINFMPNAVREPNVCIRATLRAAQRVNFRQDRLMFEFTEQEKVTDVEHVRTIIETYKARGFTTAIDDFGSGYAGLKLLAEFQPDVLKVDLSLIRGVDTSPARQAILSAIVIMADALGIVPLAEGIETQGELKCIREIGIKLCQGFLFAMPSVEQLPVVEWGRA